jgi:N-acetylglutamate synthase-like GNAT family acetyltransferase
MTTQNDTQTYSIIPFDKHHQPDINDLMTEIQKEFDTTFTTPHSKSISDLVGQGNTFWVALNQNKVIGTIGLSHFDSKTGILRLMFVAKEYRGTQLSVAKKLLDIAVAEAKRLSYTDIYLGTMTQFNAAQSFYSKNNFVSIPKTSLPDKMTLSANDTVFYVLKINYR